MLSIQELLLSSRRRVAVTRYRMICLLLKGNGMYCNVSALCVGVIRTVKVHKGQIVRGIFQNYITLQGREKASRCVNVSSSPLRPPTQILSLAHHRFQRTFVQFEYSVLSSSSSLLVFYVTCNNISVIYVTAQMCRRTGEEVVHTVGLPTS